MKTTWVTVLVVCVLWGISSASAGVVVNENEFVTIKEGVIRGNVMKDHRQFLGIPFAEPPVGDLRWAYPQEVKAWGSAVKATQSFGKACPQVCKLPPDTCPETDLDEDCLTLNVWTPIMDRKGAATANLPVLFWIPGGRFLQGTSNIEFYNGKYLTLEGVVVVSVNYRLGSLGFFTSESLKGNFGLEDQILALQWVQNNVAAFGGNPKDVTIAGQSAGAGAVASHLVNPLTVGLYHKAIMMSNPWGLPWKTPKQAIAVGDKLANAVGCKQNDEAERVACLRQVPVKDLIEKQGTVNEFPFPDRAWRLAYPWAVTVGTDQVADEPYNLIRLGKYNKVPILMGTVKDEARPFVYGAMKTTSWLKYVSLTDYLFGIVNGFEMRNMYNKEGSDNRDVMSEMVTDYLFDCTSLNVADSFVRDGVPVYHYWFTHALSFEGWGPDFPFCQGYACHGVELPFLFDSAKTRYHPTQGEEDLSHKIMQRWANFAKHTNPNGSKTAVAGPSDPYWHAYEPKNQGMVWIKDGPWEFVQNHNKHRCQWWTEKFLHKDI